MHSSDASNGDQQSQQRAGQLPDFDSGATDRLDCSHGIFAPTLTQHTSHNPSGSDPRNSTPSSIHEKVAHGINIINLCFCNGCVSLLYCVMIHNHVLMRRYDTCRDTRKRQRSPSRSSSARRKSGSFLGAITALDWRSRRRASPSRIRLCRRLSLLARGHTPGRSPPARSCRPSGFRRTDGRRQI